MGWGRQLPPPGTPLNKGLDFVRSLAALWPFNERAGLTTPEPVNAIDGRLTAAVDSPDGGFRFSTGGFFQAPTSPRFDGTYGTLAFWMRSVQPGNFVLLMSRADSNSRNGISIIADASTTRARVQIYNASALVQDITGSTTNICDGNRHHIAVTWDRSLNGPSQLYVDGKLEAAAFNTGAWSFNGQVLRAAISLDPFWSPNTGTIDLPMWFNRILFPGEVKQLALDPYFMFFKKRRRTIGIPTTGVVGSPWYYNRLLAEAA